MYEGYLGTLIVGLLNILFSTYFFEMECKETNSNQIVIKFPAKKQQFSVIYSLFLFYNFIFVSVSIATQYKEHASLNTLI